MLTPNQISEYAGKWLKGTITPEEKKLFEEWYNKSNTETIEWKTDESEEDVYRRIFTGIQKEIEHDNPVMSVKRVSSIQQWYKVAAVVFVIISIGVFIWPKKLQELPTANSLPKEKNYSAVENKVVGYIRHITLPDGSTVVLQANSRLDFPNNFSGTNREVVLVGEAYFDIHHDEKRPFIIHTEQIKTTVLGTAFNINAYPGAKKITVSVSRGKVKVEDNTKLLAVLLPDQKITFDRKDAKAIMQPVNAVSEITDWTKQDMVFENLPFEEIIKLLNRRYNVEISFKNAGLGQCTIKAFFEGIEPLEKVLDVLCIITNASYTTDNNGKNIVLDGKGCGR